ncbi:MAG: hypothetical protein ABI769_06315 [Pseudomonadota bacterium]
MNPQECTELANPGQDENVGVEDDLDDEEDTDDEDEDDDQDADDDVGTDERGKEMLKADPVAEPDVSSDRGAPSEVVSPGHARVENRKPPLDIKQIEEIEDDAPGG